MVNFLLQTLSVLIGILLSFIGLKMMGYTVTIKKSKSRKIPATRQDQLKEFSERLENTLESIRDYFPEIDSKHIKFNVQKGTNYLMAYTHVSSSHSYKIKVDWFLRKANDSALKGVLAHELVHIVDSIKRSKQRSYPFIENITEMERETDLEVIHRGLGNELYALLKFHNKHSRKYKKEDGLTKKEIKKIMEKSNQTMSVSGPSLKKE